MPRTIGADPKRRSGSAGKRYPLNMRTTKVIRDHLERAAEASGRSLAQEVEFRLEQSVQEEGVYGGPELAALFKQIAGAVSFIEQKTGRRWREHQETFMAVVTAFKGVLAQIEGMRPLATPQSVEMVHDLIAMEPKEPALPNMREPTEAELSGGTPGGLLGGLLPEGFASAQEAKRAAVEWSEYRRRKQEYDVQLEAYRQRLSQVNAYFEQFTKLGEIASVGRSVVFGEEAAEARPMIERGQQVEFSSLETQILARLRQGKQNNIIAYELDIDQRTVEEHIQEIMRKLNARNRTRVVVLDHNARKARR